MIMGEVDAFHVPGFKCYFPASDHYPQHFEVYRRGEYVVRIFFLRTGPQARPQPGAHAADAR